MHARRSGGISSSARTRAGPWIGPMARVFRAVARSGAAARAGGRRADGAENANTFRSRRARDARAVSRSWCVCRPVLGLSAGGRIAGVRTWREARPPDTFLGATAETRVPLKADLFAPTRAGLTAAIDMVTAAIAKSGVTCGCAVRAGMPGEAHAGFLKSRSRNGNRKKLVEKPTSASRGSHPPRRIRWDKRREIPIKAGSQPLVKVFSVGIFRFVRPMMRSIV